MNWPHHTWSWIWYEWERFYLKILKIQRNAFWEFKRSSNLGLQILAFLCFFYFNIFKLCSKFVQLFNFIQLHFSSYKLQLHEFEFLFNSLALKMQLKSSMLFATSIPSRFQSNSMLHNPENTYWYSKFALTTTMNQRACENCPPPFNGPQSVCFM